MQGEILIEIKHLQGRVWPPWVAAAELRHRIVRDNSFSIQNSTALRPMRHLVHLVFCIAALSGCASITHDPLQSITVETASSDGTKITGAECVASNDFGKYSALSGGRMAVRRSADTLELLCRYPGQTDAEGRVISRFNTGMAGNIIAGGVTGAIVDQATGNGYSYPNWIRLIFGKSLVFDRASEKEGSPHSGIEPGKSEK